MRWKKAALKGFLGAATFTVSFIAANPQVVTQFVPENILKMSVGGLISSAIVFVANWIKHKNDIA